MVVNHKRPSRRIRRCVVQTLSSRVKHKIRNAVVIHINVCLVRIVPKTIQMVKLIRISVHVIVTIRNTHIVTTTVQPRIFGRNVFKIYRKCYLVVRIQFLSICRFFKNKTTICQHVNTVTFHCVGRVIRIFVANPFWEIITRNGTCFTYPCIL